MFQNGELEDHFFDLDPGMRGRMREAEKLIAVTMIRAEMVACICKAIKVLPGNP